MDTDKNRISSVFIGLASVAIFLSVFPSLAAEAPSKPTPVLIVDGINNHDWARATQILKSFLIESKLFTVDVSTTPAANASKEDWTKWRPDFTKYQVVISNFNGGHTATGTRWPPEVEKALEDYVNNGGGLVVYHAANNSFLNWKAYNDMIGLGWRSKDFGPSIVISPEEKVVEIPKGQGRNPGHGPEHDFVVTTLNTEHPITKGMPKKWLHPFEQLTHGQHGPAQNMTILTYAWSKDAKENEPMDWAIPYGKGRVYTTMLGHLWKDKPDTALQCIGFQTLFIRGTEWAATGNVTYAVPAEFPTETQIRIKAAVLTPAIPAMKVETRKTEDSVAVQQDGGRTVTSKSGIGGATIQRPGNVWPETMVVRLKLRGLEQFSITSGNKSLRLSVPSHGDRQQLLHLWTDGKEGPPVAKDSPFWTEVRRAGDAFQLTIPKGILDSPAVDVNWIDFYR